MGAPFGQRLQSCLQVLMNITTEHRNVFPEIAAAHPMYEAFTELSLGINLVGNMYDNTDRVLVRNSLAHEASLSRPQGGDPLSALLRCIPPQSAACHAFADEGFFGRMNWVEIGNENNKTMAIHGRSDIVAFCAESLQPALIHLALEAERA